MVYSKQGESYKLLGYNGSTFIISKSADCSEHDISSNKNCTDRWKLLRILPGHQISSNIEILSKRKNNATAYPPHCRDSFTNLT